MFFSSKILQKNISDKDNANAVKNLINKFNTMTHKNFFQNFGCRIKNKVIISYTKKNKEQKFNDLKTNDPTLLKS